MKTTSDIIGENVRKLRGDKSLAKVSRDTGIQVHYLSSIEKGKANVTMKILDRLADYFGISVVKLLGYDPKPRPIVKYDLVVSEKPLYGDNIENFIPVPLLEDPASLGPGLVINEADTQGACLISRGVLKKGGEYQAVFVRGDSMSPILNDGDIVAIDVRDRDPKKLKGKLVACHTGDYEVTVKLLRLVKDKFYFKALNPKWEEENLPLIVPQKDGLVLGKVVWAWREFK